MSSRSEQTRNRIYEAALEEFAQFGVAGARVDRIAQAAQANKQAIYLYYGDKDKLFSTVLGRALDELAEAVPPSSETWDVADYIDRLFTYHQEHPSILRLLLWEALEYNQVPVPDEDSRTAHYQEKARAVGGAGALTGPDGKDLGSQAVLLLFTGLVGWPLAVPQVTRMIMGDEPDALDRVKSAAVAAAQAIAGQP
ncbi:MULTISPECIES: TetR family transcriptional regulator [unclassified Streptomyces]|uniref:TetR family transcriptional regulator n=1 Tax=unclassified Streptomyces TaxID=2593676 RepID=UPI0037FF8084